MKKITLLALMCTFLGLFTVQAQFHESFDDATTPADWSVINNGGPGTWEFGVPPSGSPHSGAGNAYITYNSAAHDDYLVTPQFTVAAGSTDQIRFYGRNNGTTFVDKFNLVLSTTGNAASDFTVTLASALAPADTWTEYTYDLSAYEGEQVYVAFQAISTNELRLNLDDVYVEAIPTCPRPSDLEATVLSQTEAELTWVENGQATEWEVLYGETGFNPDTEGTSVADNDGTLGLTLTGLSPDTKYDIYVRAICGAGDESILSDMGSFLTGYCEFSSTSTTRFIDDFETQGGDQNISNTGSGMSPNGYGNFTNFVVSTYAGGNFDFTTDFADGTYGFNMWIDLNSDLVFDESEKVFASAGYGDGFSGNIMIPVGTPNGDYRIRIVADYFSTNPSACGVNNNAEAEDYTLSVIDVPSCVTPIGLTVLNITAEGADLSWTPLGTETEWEVLYGEAGFDPTTEGTLVPVNTTPETTITGLDANSQYQFYVKAICSANDESNLAGPKTFTTACTSTSVPYLLDFESAIVPELPNCTSRENVGTGNNWVTGTRNNGSLSGNVLQYGYDFNNPANAWFYTQGIEMQAGVNYQILYSYDASSTYPEKMKVAYGTSADATAMTEELANYPNIVGPEDKMVNFTVAADGVYYFGFNVYSDANQLNLYVDNINIIVAPTCPIPTDLMVSDISQDSATLSWTPGSSETEWEVLYGEAGFDPTTAGTMVPVSTDPETTITGLTNNTEYEFYVTAICGVGDESLIAGPMAFTTVCEATSVPYLLDFESVVTPALPDCTTVENVGTGNNWDTNNVTTNGFDGNALRYSYDFNNPANTWFYTQGLELVAGTEYQIAYKYGNTSTSYVESMKVAYGSSPDAAAMTNDLANYASITGGAAAEESITFVVPTDGVYYFGFNAYSIANQLTLYVDNISIKEAVDCEAVTDITVTDITATSVTVSWVASPSALNGYVVDVFAAGADPQTGTPVVTQTVAAGTNTADITGLTADTSYDVYVTSDCGTGNTMMSTAVPFTTAILGLNDNNLSQISYFPNPVKEQLTITATNKIETVTVYNLLGQQLMQVQPRGTNVIVDMASLPTGTYLLKANVEGAVSTFKVIKQ